jgi:nitric oxide reductase NorQ protein
MNNGIFTPVLNDTYFIDEDIENLFERIEKNRNNKTQKILLQGPHGAGKTEMAMHYAAVHNLPMLIMDCANLREARDWFGYKKIENGNVVWHESQFDRAIQNGNMVVLLDEINRVHPNVMNTLLPLLDNREFTYLEEKNDVIRLGKGIVFFATMNEGAGYSGTNATDNALRDRFSRVVEVKYLNPDKEKELLVKRTGIEEKDALGLVDIANQIRKKSMGLSSSFSSGFSTRQLIAAAEDFVEGGVDSLTFTVSNLFSSDGGTTSERASVLQLIQGKFGLSEPKTAKARIRGH